MWEEAVFHHVNIRLSMAKTKRKFRIIRNKKRKSVIIILLDELKSNDRYEHHDNHTDDDYE